MGTALVSIFCSGDGGRKRLQYVSNFYRIQVGRVSMQKMSPSRLPQIPVKCTRIVIEGYATEW
jgi:hypothetical protein